MSLLRTLRRRRLANERGAAAVEFAIVLVPLVLLVFGIVQFSIAYNRNQGLHAAAREGARVGALPQTTHDEIVARTLDALEGSVPRDEASVTVSPANDRPCNAAGGSSSDRTVTVEVRHPYVLDIPMWGGDPNVTLTGRGEFRCESGGA